MRHLIARAAALAAAAAAIALPATAAAAAGPPALSWTPATAGSYSYGTPAGGQTAAKTFTLANSGGSATSALTITLTGPAAFAKTADTCTGTSLGPGKTCTVTVAYTAAAVPGQAATATLTATSANPKATAALALAGATAKAAPALATASSPGGTVGTTVTDTATLTGGYQPGGTIEFKLYPAPGCTGTPADDETVKVTGNGTYTTPAGAAPGAGSYSWTAAYTGDGANAGIATACGADTVTLAKAAPALTTSGQGGPVGVTVTDTATLSGGYQPAGTIEFKLYPTADCSGTPADDETVPVHGDGTYTTPHGYPSAPLGTYSWTAAYSGDANNAPAATTGCTDTVTIVKATPAITHQASGGLPDVGQECVVGSTPACPPTADTATLSGGDNPTGTIEFKLLYFGNGVIGCSGTPVADETVTVHGDGSYATPTAFPVDTTIGSSAGGTQVIFTWVASYSGDANNNPATTGCTDAGEVFYQLGL